MTGGQMFSSELELVGSSPKNQKAIEFAQNVSVTKSPVLLVGESGTGKRTLARYIHSISARKGNPILVVDCAQDGKKVENDVLGFRDPETGRFNKGVLERANNGTVVLANVDGLDDNFQMRLYTILQELADYDIDVRVVATTCKNLSKYVGAGRFHRALYTYFSNTQINLIPLRERTTDIQQLATHFVNEFCAAKNLSLCSIDDEAMNKITSYYWSHNIAELKSVIETAVENSTTGVIDINAIELGEKKSETLSSDDGEDGIRLMSLKEAEKLLIKKALVHTSENRTQAAKILGVSIRTLRNKINEYRNDGNSYFVNLR
jgi:two-component system response regulator FlrC